MEKHLLETFGSIIGNLREGEQSFLDVGANIGIYTWKALDKKPNLHVAAFEPDPRNAALLKKTQNRWNASNLHLHFTAASNNQGQATFSQDLLSSATGSLEKSGPLQTRTPWRIAWPTHSATFAIAAQFKIACRECR